MITKANDLLCEKLMMPCHLQNKKEEKNIYIQYNSINIERIVNWEISWLVSLVT